MASNENNTGTRNGFFVINLETSSCGSSSAEENVYKFHAKFIYRTTHLQSLRSDMNTNIHRDSLIHRQLDNLTTMPSLQYS